MAEIKNYYDDLAKYYKLIYFDWEGSVKRQAGVLDTIICENFGPSTKEVLDVGCGIGTQAIGLAELGYEISAADISEQELKQAKIESQQRNLTIDFRLGDMRRANEIFDQQFDLIIACDNCIPHLLTNADILTAFTSFSYALKENGGVLISVRDYEKINKEGKQIFPRHIHQDGRKKTILFDVWEFDDQVYYMTTYVIEDDGTGPAKIQAIRGGKYFCIATSELETIFKKAGFSGVKTIRDRYFQPLIIAHKKQT